MDEAKKAYVTESAEAAYPILYSKDTRYNRFEVDSEGASLRVFLKRARDKEAAHNEAGILSDAPTRTIWPLFYGLFEFEDTDTVSFSVTFTP